MPPKCSSITLNGRIMGKEHRIQPIGGDSSRGADPDRRTLDPAGAASFQLPPSFKLDPGESNKWPDGFWDHFNRAASFYKRGQYQKAKHYYLAAHSLLSTYNALDTALLRTYRKLYKASIQNERWDQAYRELSDLFRVLPSAVTDTDRRQFNKVVEQLRSMNAEFAARPLPLDKDRHTKRDKPLAEAESATGITIMLEADKAWSRAKGEKSPRWHERLTTTKEFVAISHNYDSQAGGYASCRIWTYSADGERVSESELPQAFYRLKISSSGDLLIGYSDDLKMSLWNMAGDRLAERDIAREAEGNKYHVRCVDVTEGADRALLTSSTRAYLLDKSLGTLGIWTMPPPEGYEVGHRDLDMRDGGIEEALSMLELAGHPTQAELKTQFRRLALLHHPDRNPGDPTAEERMKKIIAAYELLSEEDVLEALDGLDGGDYYYRIFHEADIELPGAGLSFGFTMSMSGPGDWIYASHMTPRAERIYLGCYSGTVYCVNASGDVLSIYSTDDPIRGLMEWNDFLYIWTHGSMYVIERGRVANHLDLRNRDFECFAQWGFVIREGSSLALFSPDGTWLGAVHLSKPPREIIPTTSGLIACTTKERFRVSLSGQSGAPLIES